MTLSTETVAGLTSVLKDCVARITQLDGSKPAGAAFFVSDHLLVTNRHVVGEAPDSGTHQVRVHPFGADDPVTGTVRPQTDLDLDIVLVEVEPQLDLPAVVLHHEIADGGFVMVGYPREDFHTEGNPGLEAPPTTGHTRYDNHSRQPQLLRITDVQIKPGFSGGPMLSTETGAVVAVTEYTENEKADLGGGALPVSLILEAYPELRSLAAEPPAASTQRWRALLQKDRWESLGLVWDRDQQLDIHLSGDRSKWFVGLHPGGEGPERSVRDLGDDMGEVLVRWARSTGRRDESEVRLLGRLLSAAVFSEAVARQLPPPAATNQEPVLVRLHVDDGGQLADLPWEFVVAPPPRDPDTFLAASDGYAFVRVGNDAPVGARRLHERPAGTPVRVLAVVVQPETVGIWPSIVQRGEPKAWPKSTQLAGDLQASICATTTPGQQSVFEVEMLVNPTLSQLMLRAEQGEQVDVVHYVGFGFRDAPDPDPQNSFADLDRCMIAVSEGPDSDDLHYGRAGEVLKPLAALEPSLSVFEFGIPPLDEKLARGCEPIGPSMLGAARLLGVDALVCTRPLHPRQYLRFNGHFYQRLAAGQSVEQAVQLARQALLVDTLLDFAGFGWFMVTTGNTPRPRFFAAPKAGARGQRPVAPVATGTTRNGEDDFNVGS